MKFVFKIFLICSAFSSFAQNDNVFTIAEKMPEFQGGTDALAKYLAANVKYPFEAIEGNYTGKSYVNFVVDTNGKVLSPKIIKSSGYKCLDDEAYRVVESMPNWIAGMDYSKKVSVTVNIPIIFGGNGKTNPDETPSGFSISKGARDPSIKKMSPEESEKHDKAMKYYYQGHKFEQEQKFDKALEKFDLSLAQESQNEFALFDKAKMHLNLGDKTKACDIWNKMIRLNLRKEEAELFVKKNCN